MAEFYQMRAVQTPNMIIQTVGVLGLMGLVLAMVGLYGLVSYSVARRVREIGIRMAIGAEKTQVLSMVLKQGIVLGPDWRWHRTGGQPACSPDGGRAICFRQPRYRPACVWLDGGPDGGDHAVGDIRTSATGVASGSDARVTGRVNGR